MKDIERRIYLIENGYFDKYLEKRRFAYKNGLMIIDQNGKFDTEYFDMNFKDCQICERIRKCCKEQREKVERHIKFLFNKNHYEIYFVTFTFSNESINNLTREKRKRSIRMILSKFNDFILNIDYGLQTEREHYHAIVALDKDLLDKRYEKGHLKISQLDNYNLGNYDIERIKTDEVDSKRLSRYITKLTLHSVKVKQNYISVKKGSEYQEWKKTIENIKNFSRSGRINNGFSNLYDQMSSLEY